MRRTTLVSTIFILFATAACSGTVEPDQPSGDEENLTVLGPGEKADNFRSESAQEYFVRGTSTVELTDRFADASEEERLRRVRELVPYKQLVIGYFLNSYLIDKSSDSDNSDYGGFKALTKNGSYEDLGIERIGGLTYSFEFVQEVGGQLDLLRELSRRSNAEPAAGGGYTFEVAVGHVSNEEMTQIDSGNEWYRSSPWSSFSTESVDASKYYMQDLTIEPQERSADAWIEYDKLFEDGSVDIAVFFGWDYHNAYHQKHAEDTYEWLVENGYRSPVGSWEAYATNRAPLTRTIRAMGRQVEVNVTLWWGEPETETAPGTDAGGRRLEEAMRESFRTNEVTAFSGHSGPWYGFAIGNWKQTSEGEIDDSEIPDLEMPSDQYQVVLAEGCDTYALGEAFWKNPNKADEETLDVITTTSFSSAGSNATITDFLGAVVGTDAQGRHETRRYGQMLENMDGNSFFFDTMYGVHGIDDNPTSHPYAQEDAICTGCSSNADCGGAGNHCVDLQGASVCTYECTADSGCPDGYTCRETRAGNRLSTSVCVPADYVCSTDSNDGDGSADGPQVRVRELLADPPSGSAGDVNGDGTRDASDDEYLELANTGDEAVDVSGWRIADSVTTRFRLPADVVLAPGDRIVVFGGGDPAAYSGLPESATIFASTGLYLNNRGDTVALLDHNAEEIDRVEYGTEGGGDRALVRRDGELTPTEGVGTPGR